MIAERSGALEANGAGTMGKKYVAVRLILLTMLVLGTAPAYVFGPVLRESLFQSPYCKSPTDRTFAPSFFLRSPVPQIDSGGLPCARGPLKQLIMLSVLASVFEHALSGLLLIYRHRLPIKCLTAIALLSRALGIGSIALTAKNYYQLPKELTLFLIAVGGEPVFVGMLSLASSLINVHHTTDHLPPIPEDSTCSRGGSRETSQTAIAARYITPSARPAQITSVLIYGRWVFAGLLVTTRLSEQTSLMRLALICGLIWPLSLLLSKIGWSKKPYLSTNRRWLTDWMRSDQHDMDRCAIVTSPHVSDSARIIMSNRGLLVCTSAIASTIHATTAVTLLKSGSDMRLALLLAFGLIYPLGLIILLKRRLLISIMMPLILLCIKHLPYFNRREQISPAMYISRNNQLLIITAGASLASLSIQHCHFIAKSFIKDQQFCVNYTPFYGFVLLLSGIAAANAYYFIAYRASEFLYVLMAMITVLPMGSRVIYGLVRPR